MLRGLVQSGAKSAALALAAAFSDPRELFQNVSPSQAAPTTTIEAQVQIKQDAYYTAAIGASLPRKFAWHLLGQVSAQRLAQISPRGYQWYRVFADVYQSKSVVPD